MGGGYDTIGTIINKLVQIWGFMHEYELRLPK